MAALEACPWTPDDCAFAQGYLDAGGPLVYLTHFVEAVLPCEGGPDWSIGEYGNGYVSRAQFDPGSWATASRATGMGNPRDPYQVGVNVAWWVQHIDHPGGRGGWGCW